MTSLNDGRPLTAVDTESTQVSQTLCTLRVIDLHLALSFELLVSILGVKLCEVLDSTIFIINHKLTGAV